MWPSQESCESPSVVLIVPSYPLSKRGTVNKAAKYKPHHKVFLSMSNTPETTRHHTHVGSHCALSSARHSMFTPTRIWIHRISNQKPNCGPALPPTTGWLSLGFVHTTTASFQDAFATYSFPYPAQIPNFNCIPQPQRGYWESECGGHQFPQALWQVNSSRTSFPPLKKVILIWAEMWTCILQLILLEIPSKGVSH